MARLMTTWPVNCGHILLSADMGGESRTLVRGDILRWYLYLNSRLAVPREERRIGKNSELNCGKLFPTTGQTSVTILLVFSWMADNHKHSWIRERVWWLPLTHFPMLEHQKKIVSSLEQLDRPFGRSLEPLLGPPPTVSSTPQILRN